MEKEQIAALVKQAQSGDRNAMENLLRVAHTPVSYQCRKFFRNPEDAEDLTQEVLLRIAGKLHTIDDPEKFLSWANRIAARCCINAQRKKPDECQFFEDEEGHSYQDNLEELDTQKIPDAAIDQAETARMIQVLIDDLPQAQRLVTYLFYYDQLSVKEIASMIGVSENTIKSRLNYARKAIKDGVLDYEKKDGIKLYGLSPLPFLLYFLRRSAESSADATAAGAMAQTAMAAGTTGASAGAAVSSAAGKTAGVFSGVTAKAAAGLIAAAIAVGGISAAVSGMNGQQAVTTPEISHSSTETVTELPPDTSRSHTEAATQLTGETTIPAEPYTTLRTTIDPQGYDAEIYLETPQFTQESDGYRKINAFFEEMRAEFQNGGDEKVTFMFERLAEMNDTTYSYTRTFQVKCQTERYVSVVITGWWYAGGQNDSLRENYTFDAQTGELLELTDLIDGTEEEIGELVANALIAEYGETVLGYESPHGKSYDDFIFYIEDDQIWVFLKDPLFGARALPYVPLSVELE